MKTISKPDKMPDNTNAAKPTGGKVSAIFGENAEYKKKLLKSLNKTR